MGYSSVGNKVISKQQMAYERIKEAILTEQYKEDQLLSTRELSDEFGISRTPVMQALRRLAYEGFIDDIYQTVSKSIEHFIY